MNLGHNDAERRPMHVVVCSASLGGWRSFADSQGVTLTALVDAIGHLMAAPRDDCELLPTAQRAISVARSIDAARRSRPKGSHVGR